MLPKSRELTSVGCKDQFLLAIWGFEFLEHEVEGGVVLLLVGTDCQFVEYVLKGAPPPCNSGIITM